MINKLLQISFGVLITTFIISCKTENIEKNTPNIPEDYNIIVKLFDHPFEAKVEAQNDFNGDGKYETTLMTAFDDYTYGLKIPVADGQQYVKFFAYH